MNLDRLSYEQFIRNFPLFVAEFQQEKERSALFYDLYIFYYQRNKELYEKISEMLKQMPQQVRGNVERQLTEWMAHQKTKEEKAEALRNVAELQRKVEALQSLHERLDAKGKELEDLRAKEVGYLNGTEGARKIIRFAFRFFPQGWLQTHLLGVVVWSVSRLCTYLGGNELEENRRKQLEATGAMRELQQEILGKSQSEGLPSPPE